jgi:hypothetical protein
MARTVSEGFEEFLKRLTPTQAQRDAGAAHRASVKGALEANLTVNNFFETGSFSHGTGVRHHSDIDALVSLGHDRPGTSYTALTWVKDALSKRFPFTTVQIRRPAVQVQFGGGYETWEIIPGFLTGRGGDGVMVYDIPSPVTGGGWIDAAPKEHLAYVNECNETPLKADQSLEVLPQRTGLVVLPGDAVRPARQTPDDVYPRLGCMPGLREHGGPPARLDE